MSFESSPNSNDASLWEQAIDDAAHTGDYTAADAIALRARLRAEIGQTPVIYNEQFAFGPHTLAEYSDAAVEQMLLWSLEEPETYFAYEQIHNGFAALSTDAHLPLPIRKLAEDNRYQLSVLYPEFSTELFRQRRINTGHATEEDLQ
jgi:hypothetical protein